MTLTVRELADRVRGEVVGDGDQPIRNARPLSDAGPGDITFVDGDRYLAAWHACGASAAIVPPGTPANGRPLIQVPDPLAAFTSTVLEFRGVRPPARTGRIDPLASIHPSASVGPDCSIGPFVVVGEGSVVGARCHLHPGAVVGRFCTLGDDCVLHPHAVLYDDCVLGHRVTVHANAVLGADGFGYRTQDGRHVLAPQLGSVEVGDDVDIGAGTTIDRGTFGPTSIGHGTKIDNLVMIAHNCRIGPHNLLVSQVGIAGSTVTGEHVIMAGQVGIGDHIAVGDRAVIGAQSGVHKDIPADSRMLGTPATPIRDQMKIMMIWEKLPDIRRDVRKIKETLGLKDSP